jgi:SAM-dependent methyltransferase
VPFRQIGKKVKVLIGVPCLRENDRYASYREDILHYIEASIGNVPHEVFVTGPTQAIELVGIVEAGNVIVDKFLSGDYDYLWQVELDVQVPEDAFQKLLDLNVDVACGYVRRHGEPGLICGYLDENMRVWYLPENAVKGQILSGWVMAGTSCLLIKRRVFEAGIRFRYVRGVSPDIVFMFDLQSAGFTAKVHGDVLCGHLPQWPLTTNMPLDARRKPSFDVLDVGCGHQPKGDVNVDLHPEPTAHRAADQRVCNDVKLDLRNTPNFVKAEASRLPFRDSSFNSVCSNHVLEHVLLPDLVLAEMLRVSDRWVEVHVPHPDLKGAYGPEKPLHRNKITRDWLEEHLKGYDSQIRDEVNQSLPIELWALVDKKGVVA